MLAIGTNKSARKQFPLKSFANEVMFFSTLMLILKSSKFRTFQRFFVLKTREYERKYDNSFIPYKTSTRSPSIRMKRKNPFQILNKLNILSKYNEFFHRKCSRLPPSLSLFRLSQQSFEGCREKWILFIHKNYCLKTKVCNMFFSYNV